MGDFSDDMTDQPLNRIASDRCELNPLMGRPDRFAWKFLFSSLVEFAMGDEEIAIILPAAATSP